jgi:hypothetical protein
MATPPVDVTGEHADDAGAVAAFGDGDVAEARGVAAAGALLTEKQPRGERACGADEEEPGDAAELLVAADRAQRLAIVELHLDSDALIADPAHAGDYVLSRCPARWVHEIYLFDGRDQVPPPDEVREYAQLMVMARGVEHVSQSIRLAAGE